jgi:hypothetical protein
MASISPVCKKFKHFILALKSPTYRDFMIKKSLKSKTSKSHTWAPLSQKVAALYYFENAFTTGLVTTAHALLPSPTNIFLPRTKKNLS